MQKAWNDYTVEETLLINKSYYYYLKCYLKEKGFSSKDRTFTLKNDNNIGMGIDVFDASMRIIFFVRQEKKVTEIWLHRYALYPDVLDVGSIVQIPNPDWGYGFIEQMIFTLEKTLLNSLVNKSIIYNDILENHKIYFKDFISKPHVVQTAETFRNEENKMLEIPFKTTYLSFERYKNHENPFKGLRSVKQLPEVSTNYPTKKITGNCEHSAGRPFGMPFKP